MSGSVTRIDWVLQRISEGIQTGELKPGQRLKSHDLAKRWEVSPTPVREALQRLAAVGLVEAQAQKGMRVAPLIPKDMREVYSLRLLLEPFALRVSLENRTPEWEGDVEAKWEDLREELAHPTVEVINFERVHSAFHNALMSECGSSWMERLTAALGAHSVRYRILSLGPRGGAAHALTEHEELLETCLGDDIDAAVAFLFQHIKGTVETIGDVYETEADRDRLATLLDAAGDAVHTGVLR